MKILLILGFFLLTSYAISVTTCQNITSSGTYILQNDLVGANITPIPIRTNGCLIVYADDVILDGNGFSIMNNGTDDAVGIEIFANNTEIKNFNNISLYSFAIYGFHGNNTQIHNVSLLTNLVGAIFYELNNSRVYNNSIENAISEGILLGFGQNTSIYDNYFYNSSIAINATSLGNNTYISNNRFNYTGYAVAIQNSNSNVSYNNIFNSTYGIGILGDNSLSLINTIVSYNNISLMSQIGIQLETAQNSTVIFNDVSNSTAAIYAQFDLLGPLLEGNIIHNNGFGTTIDSSNQSSISYEHYFNNTQDLQISSLSSDLSLQFNATGLIFDAPLGDFQNYTNISINDILNPQSRYFFNWSAQPADVFSAGVSFHDKYINFTNENESNAIDQVIWHWTAAEEAGFDPADLNNKFYTDSWDSLPAIPDTVQNTLTQNNITTSGIYGLFETPIIGNCPIISASGSYIMTADFTGAPNDISEIQSGATACVKFATSDIELNCAGYSVLESGASGLNWAFASNNTELQNITIKNCMIQNYEVGINLLNTTHTILFNNTLLSTAYSQILLNTISNANVSTNTLTSSSSQRAISVQNGDNNTVENNVVSGGGYSGIFLYHNTNSSVINNSLTTFNNYGIEIDTADDIDIQLNTISATTIDAIYATTLTNGTILNNSLSSASYSMSLSGSLNVLISNNTFLITDNNGPRFDNANNVTFTTNNLTATATGGIGTWFVSSTNSLFTSNLVNGFGYYALAIEGSSYINVTNNTINNTGAGNGIGIITSSSYVNATNNTVSNAQYGIYLLTSDYSIVFNNSLDDNIYGVYANANNNLIDRNTITNSVSGIYLTGTTNNVIQNNLVRDMSDTCIFVQTSTNTITHDNSVYTCNFGIYYSNSANGIVANNSASSSTYGFYSISSLGSSDNKIVQNNIGFNNQYGIHIQYTDNDLIFNNSFFNNSVIGISAQDSRNLTIRGNQIYNNTLGSRFFGATFSTYNGSYSFDHFYNNSNDLKLQSNGGNNLLMRLNGVIFDNPVGNMTYYTNLSLNDTVGGGNSYLLSWSPGNSPLPANVSSFRQKYVNISLVTGTPAIDQIQWSWTAAETIGYNESNLTIYNYAGTWVKSGGSLSTSDHTLSLASLSLSNAIYAVVDDEIPPNALTTLVYFVSPTPTNNTNITTTPVVITLNHLNGTLSSPCFIQLNGVNQTGTIAGDACSYSFTPTINNTNYNVTGYMNLTGTMVQSNETRTFTWFSTPTPPNPNLGGGGFGSGGYVTSNNTNVTQVGPLQPIVPQQQDYKWIVIMILLLMALLIWARRKK